MNNIMENASLSIHESAEVNSENNIATILLPAKNEAHTICRCIDTYRKHPKVGEIIVIANGCVDNTAILARNCKASVIETSISGKGNALMLGAQKAKFPILISIDSDNTNPHVDIITKLLSSSPSNKRIVKGSFNREVHPGPVTDILLKPILKISGHPLGKLSQPLSGVFACGTSWFRSLKLPAGFGVDLQIVLAAINTNIEIHEVDIVNFEHKNRDWNHYREMSIEIVEVLFENGFIKRFSKNVNEAGSSDNK